MSQEATGRSRKRGRPPGSGSINDTRELVAVADLLAAKKAKTPRAAMRRVVKGIGDSHLRRLQAKWKDQGEALLAAARDRIRRREASKGGLVVTLDRGAWSSLPPVPSLTEGWNKAMASRGIEPVVLPSLPRTVIEPVALPSLPRTVIEPVALPRTAMAELSPLMGHLSPPPASVAEIPSPRISGAMAGVVNPLGRAIAAAGEFRGEPRIVSLGRSPLEALGSADRARVRDAPVLGPRDPTPPPRRR